MTNPTHDPAPATPTLRTYAGSCHCGDVRFEARLDLRAGALKCNCSICRKGNFLGAKVTPADFTQLAGRDALRDYQFNTKSVHHFFCARCGIKPFGFSDIPQAGGAMYSVNVHCLEGADLTDLPVKYLDGLHDNWWNETAAFP